MNQLPNITQHATDIAVLQTEVRFINENIDEIKLGVKEVHDCLHKNSAETHLMLKDLQVGSEKAHKELSAKISTLEKWRWMMMGAGIVFGSFGVEVLAKMLK